LTPTLNWTHPVNYKVKYPDPLPKTTATLEVPNEPIQFQTQSSQVVRQWLLDKLQEESAEVIQAISKVRRFGEQNHHPDRSTTNLQELVNELEDFLAIVAALEHTRYFDLTLSQTNIHKKTVALIS
jgi:NTP pyrophosphatase (non-canonical NTP hydrolase)